MRSNKVRHGRLVATKHAPVKMPSMVTTDVSARTLFSNCNSEYCAQVVCVTQSLAVIHFDQPVFNCIKSEAQQAYYTKFVL